MNHHPMSVTTPSSSPSASGGRVQLISVHPYCPSNPSHLAFPARATISAKQGQEGNTLWFGSYKDRHGWFPISYCRLQGLQMGGLGSSLRSLNSSPRVRSRRALSYDQVYLMEEEEADQERQRRDAKNMSLTPSPRRAPSAADKVFVAPQRAISAPLLDTGGGSRTFVPRNERSNWLLSSSPIDTPPSSRSSSDLENSAPSHQPQHHREEHLIKLSRSRSGNEESLSESSSKSSSRRRRWFGGKTKEIAAEAREPKDNKASPKISRNRNNKSPPSSPKKIALSPRKFFPLKETKQKQSPRVVNKMNVEHHYVVTPPKSPVPPPPMDNIYIVIPSPTHEPEMCSTTLEDLCTTDSLSMPSCGGGDASSPKVVRFAANGDGESGVRKKSDYEPEDPIEVLAAAYRSRLQQQQRADEGSGDLHSMGGMERILASGE